MEEILEEIDISKMNLTQVDVASYSKVAPVRSHREFDALMRSISKTWIFEKKTLSIWQKLKKSYSVGKFVLLPHRFQSLTPEETVYALLVDFPSLQKNKWSLFWKVGVKEVFAPTVPPRKNGSIHRYLWTQWS